MREYNRRRGGKIILTSVIYDSVEEYKSDYPDKEPKRWGDISIATGDHVIADDGFVVECLSARIYQGKRHMLYYYRFPMGTFTVTESKGVFYTPAFYAQFSKPNLSRIGTTDGKLHKEKIRFASYIIAGFDIGEAYRRCFPHGVMGSDNAFKKGITLMRDEIVKIELKNQLESFTNKLKDKFDEDRLILELDELLAKSRKGSMAHRQNLELILQLTGYMDNPVSKKKVIEEADFREMPPPQLPS